MSDIFISYASEDRDRVKPLAKALENQGWSVWWDRTIPPGKTFDQVIEEAINAARCVVVLWSKISIKSDWVKEEANIGKERNILVPARIDPVDLPLGFGRIQAADLTDWEMEASHAGFAVFLSAISDIVGPPPQQEKPEQVAEIPESSLEQQLEVKSKESATFQPAPSHLKPEEKESPITGLKAPRRKRLVFGIGAVALILVLGVIGWFFFLKTITVSSGLEGGSIWPTGEVKVIYGFSKSFTIEPSPGYRIADVKVGGESVGAVSSYTFERVTRDGTIVASFIAVVPIVTVDGAGQRWRPGMRFSLGFTFTVGYPLSVVALGRFDVDGRGLAEDAVARLFNWDTGAALVSATIRAGTAGEAAGVYNAHYADLETPVALYPGITYLVAVQATSPDYIYDAPVTWAGGINYGSGKATPVGSPSMPATASASTFTINRNVSGVSYLGPNLKIVRGVP